jgi:hypothetical protein
MFRLAATACLLVCVVACTPEETPKDAAPPAPAIGATATVDLAPPSASESDTAAESASSGIPSLGPSRPRNVETLDVPPVELGAPAPGCTDPEGQPIACSRAVNPQAPTPGAQTPTPVPPIEGAPGKPDTPTAPPVTEPSAPEQPFEDSEEKPPAPTQATTEEADR